MRVVADSLVLDDSVVDSVKLVEVSLSEVVGVIELDVTVSELEVSVRLEEVSLSEVVGVIKVDVSLSEVVAESDVEDWVSEVWGR